MTELEQNLTRIKSEKDTKLLPENIKEGVQIFDVIGTYRGGTDTSDATAVASDIMYNKSAYANGQKIIGLYDMVNIEKLPVWYYNFNCGITSTMEDLINRNPKATLSAITSSSQLSNIKRIDNFSDIIRTQPAVGDFLINSDTRCFYNGNQNESYITLGKITEFSIADSIVLCNFKVYGGIRRAEFTNAVNIIPSNIKKNINILGVTGNVDPGIDTSDATAQAGDLALDKTMYVNGQKVTGTVPYSGLGGGMTYGPDNISIIETPDYVGFSRDDIPVTVLMYAGADWGIDVYKSSLANAIGLTANKIMTGNTILDIVGTGGSAEEQAILNILQDINGAHI